jgi:hypothetical protein
MLVCTTVTFTPGISLTSSRIMLPNCFGGHAAVVFRHQLHVDLGQVRVEEPLPDRRPHLCALGAHVGEGVHHFGMLQMIRSACMVSWSVVLRLACGAVPAAR